MLDRRNSQSTWEAKTVQLLCLERAPENAHRFPLLKTSPHCQAPTGQLLQPPALPMVTHKRGGNLGEIPVGQLRVWRQPCENKQGRSSAAASGILLATVPGAGGEAVGSTSPMAGWGEKESSLMVNVSPSRAKSTSLHGVKVKYGSTQPCVVVRTLPQHGHCYVSSEHMKTIAPYRLSSAGNLLQSRAGGLGRGQGGRVLHAESFPDKSFPYYTWQPPTDRLPEGSLKSY